MPGELVGLALGHLANPDRRECTVLERGQMREQIELLEHHPDLAPYLVDCLEIVRELRPVDDDATALPVFNAVDAAKQGRLSAAGRAADDDALSLHDLEVDLAQHGSAKAARNCPSRSNIATISTRVVSLNSAINELTIPGMTSRKACGKMTRPIMRQ